MMMYSLRLFFLSSITLVFAAVVVDAAIDVTICPVVQTGRTGHAQHAAFAASYWASEVPALNVSVRFVGAYEAGSSTVRGVVGAFVLQSSGCDAVIGPGISDIATAMNPVVNQMWVEFASSTTDFSSRFNYPYFNRVNPDVSTTQVTFAKMLQAFGWTRMNMFCSATSYGRSVAGVVAANLGPTATLYNSGCVSNALDYNSTRALLQTMAASPSRVIFFALSASDPVTKVAQQAVRDLNLTQSKILLWADSICVSGSTAWAFPGSYCVAYDVNTSRYDAFFAAYSQRPKTMFSGAIAALGFPASQIDFSSSKGNQQAYAADATRVAMRALDAYYTKNSVPPSKALDEAAAAVRGVQVPDGLSGDVYLPLGDRQRGSFKLYNALADGTIVIAGAETGDAEITLNTQQYTLGAWYTKDAMPYDVPPPPPAAPAYWAIGVALGILAVIAVPATVMLRRHLRLAARPLDGSAPFAVMFVGVKNEAEVHDLGEKNATAALTHIRGVVRDAVRRSGCFEARRVDDATVMIVAKRVESALECAGYIATDMEATEWAKLCHHPKGTKKPSRNNRSGAASLAQSDAQLRMSTSVNSAGKTSTRNRAGSLMQSVRDRRSEAVTSAHDSAGAFPLLNMGLHYGFGIIEHDPETEFVSYLGAAVNRAAAVADMATQRQILVTHEVVDVVEEENLTASICGAFKPYTPALATAASNSTSARPDEGYALFIPDDMPNGYAESVVKETRAAFESGGISTALATADAGLARRRVAVLSVTVPEITATANDGDVQHVASLLAELTELVAEYRGTTLTVTESHVMIGINCVGPIVSHAPSRAAALALKIAETFRWAPVTAGIASAHGIATSGVCIGSACSTAETMRLAAAAAGVSIAVAGSSMHDLDSKFQLLTFDCMALATFPEPCRVYAVLSEIVADDEWLYAMNKADYARLNESAWGRAMDLMERLDDATADEDAMAALAVDVTALEENVFDNSMTEGVHATISHSATRLVELQEILRTQRGRSSQAFWDARLDEVAKPSRRSKVLRSTLPVN